MSKPFALLLLVALAASTTKGTTEIVYSPYLAEHGYGLSLIGLFTSLLAVLQLASRLPVGLSYRAERARRQYALALAVFGASTSGFAFAGGQPAAVVVLAAFHGFAFGALGTLGLALVIDVTGGKRSGSSMAWYTAAISGGYALGSITGGALGERLGTAATFGVVGLLPLVAALGLLALPAVHGAPLAADRGSGLRGLLAAGGRLDRRVWLAFVVVLYLNLISDSVDAFFPILAPTLGISLATVGILRAFKSGSALFIRSSGMVLLQAVDHRLVTVVGVFAGAAAVVIMPLTSSVLVLAGAFTVVGLSRGVLRATSAATIADLRSEGKDVGLASGVYNAGLDIGSIVGPALGGAVASVVGIGPMFQILALASLGAWLAVALSSRETRLATGFAWRPSSGTVSAKR